jgi:hypothetical protein
MSLSLKKLSLALGSVVLAASAQAADWGTHDPLEWSANLVSGGFTDFYTFTLGSSSSLASTVVANNNPGHIIGGQYALLSYGTDGVKGTADDGTLGLWSFDGTTGSTSHTVSAGPGSYYYAVFGLTAGPAVYSITSAVSPVPEPETYAMLLAGLGAMGFVAARRKGPNA